MWMPFSLPPGNCQSFAPVFASAAKRPSSPAGKKTLPPSTAGAALGVARGLERLLPRGLAVAAFTQNMRQSLFSCSPSPQYTLPSTTVGVQNTGSRSSSASNFHFTSPVSRSRQNSCPSALDRDDCAPK